MRGNILNHFSKNTSGGVVVWAALTLPILMSAAALSIDVSRIHNLDQELQSASDALARAGAAELDNRSDSIVRAKRAINNLVKNDQSFAAAGAAVVEVSSIRFLKELPDNDYEALLPNMATYKPSEANFVEVTIKPTELKTFFPPKIYSKVVTVSLNASAVAGLDYGVCNIAPVYICNPYENSGQTIYEALEDPNERRRQIRLIDTGGRNSFAPGSFGYLDPSSSRGTTGASAITDAIAIDKPATCFSSDGVYLRPGKIASVRDGFNTRFDIYAGKYGAKDYRSDPRYAPAANVTKGYTPKKNDPCSVVKNSKALAMPNDDCFKNGSCTGLDGAMGDGDWDFVSYVKLNHNSAATLQIGDVSYHFNYASHTVTPANLPTRYEVYRWEIDEGKIPGEASYGKKNTNSPEEGSPQCHTSGAYAGDIDRRIIHAAVLNCGAIAAGTRFKGCKPDALPAETFVKIFLTEPMGNGKDNTIYGEMVGLVSARDSVARDRIVVSQ